MKNIILILFLTFSSIVSCQTANILTPTEFDNIKINGVNLATIKNTFGNQNAIEALFGTANEKTIDPEGEFTYFKFNGFTIGFSAQVSGSAIDSLLIGGFDITNNNSNITIQGVTVTIGDNISALGNVVFNTMNDEGKSIVYQYCDGCNNFISIRFNQSTNIITEIIYIEQT